MAATAERTDSHELASFGYKQELDRSLGGFSSFAAGFSYISILTGVIQLFAFGFLFAGPAVWWTWLIVLGGQMMAELIGASVLVVCILFAASRGPTIVFHNLGLGKGHSWHYFGAFIIGGIMSAYVMYGFDTAGTLAEETNDPRRKAPPSIIRALIAASIIGGLLILFALMAVKDIHDPNISALGLPYIIKQALGNTVGNVFLVHSAIAISVCTLAVMASCIRLLFAMARDGRLPFGTHIAHVSGRRKVPLVPTLTVGILALGILGINYSNQSAFIALIGGAIIMFYIAYRGVTVGMLVQRIRGTWPRPDQAQYFSVGRVGL